MDEQLSIVIIEWDGGRPPTTWYNRLEKLGYKVRGNKDQSPMVRRENKRGAGVIAQEGALICNSMSEARSLGHLAYSLGAKAVQVGSYEVAVLEMTNADAQALNRIQAVLGKRGKPTVEKTFTVTCQDEMRSYRHQGRGPVNCPHCGSFKITAREGEPEHFVIGTGDLLENWKATRFAHGIFEEAVIDQIDPSAGIPATAPQLAPADQTAAVNLENSKLFTQIRNLISAGIIDQIKALHLLDLGFGILETPKAERQANRLSSLQRYFERGGNPQGLELIVTGDSVDLIDLINKDREALLLVLKI